MNNRNVTADALKALLMILVITGHVMAIEKPGAQVDLYRIIYLFHMPLFLALSGYFFSANRGVVEEAQRAWSRYILPWLAATLLYFLLLAVTNEGVPFSLVQSILRPWFHLWFVPALFLFSVLTISLHTPIVVLGVFTAPVVLGWFEIDVLNLIGAVDGRYVYYGLFFSIGYFVAKTRPIPSAAASMGAILLLAAVAFWQFPNLITGVVVDLIRIGLCFAVISLMAMLPNVGQRFSGNIISRESLAIYLYHPLVILVARELEPRIGRPAYYAASLAICIGILPFAISFLRRWPVFTTLFGKIPAASADVKAGVEAADLNAVRR